jgi:hypothetical protein
MIYHVGDKVVYNGGVYYVVEGPTMGTQGSLYTISEAPPHGLSYSVVPGVWGHELSPAPQE